MTRSIDVTIELDENGNAAFHFLDNESGDHVCYHTTVEEALTWYGDLEKTLGTELISWLEVMNEQMADEMEEQEG